jgi:hypothetical protein
MYTVGTVSGGLLTTERLVVFIPNLSGANGPSPSGLTSSKHRFSDHLRNSRMHSDTKKA